MTELPHLYVGWWRIVEASTWDNKMLGSALISITGRGDRLRMFALLADVTWRATKAGMSFRWMGAWEYDQMSGTGSVRLRKDGSLSGRFSIAYGDKCTFVAERTEPPSSPIPHPPRHEDKWGRRRW